MHCVASSAKHNSTRTDAWAEEIRQYLLGKISKNQIVGNPPVPRSTDFTFAPVRRWWMFEGKRYGPPEGTLRQNWDWVVENGWRLLSQFNPRIRLSDRIEADVDWAQTLSRGVGQIRREYVLRSSGIGLDDDELNTLRGWARWIDDEWLAYARQIGIEEKVNWRNFAQETGNSFTIEQLRRWAYIAKRSRWPLLRGVVAESLRPILEPEELDRIPLPSDEATLFELLCLVRLARYLAPPPVELRWLSAESNNIVKLDGLIIYYQQTLDWNAVATCYENGQLLRSTIDLFRLGVPRRVDLAIDFADRRAGFDGIIVEAKSGAQGYEDAIAQLRVYRTARPRRKGDRYLIWCIVENSDRPDPTVDDLKCMFASAERNSDVWVFSSADNIPIVLSACFDITTESSAKF